MLALSSGAVASLSAQNVYMENTSDCNWAVVVRYADVGCNWDPPTAPGMVCNPNMGAVTYYSGANTNTSASTPGSSEVCLVTILDGSSNPIAYCGCAAQSCLIEDLDCGGPLISIDITVTQKTTTIKFAEQ